MASGCEIAGNGIDHSFAIQDNPYWTLYVSARHAVSRKTPGTKRKHHADLCGPAPEQRAGPGWLRLVLLVGCGAVLGWLLFLGRSAMSSAAVEPRINDDPAPGPAPDGMVWVPGGVYWRGNDTEAHRDSRPWHLVEVSGFWMDAVPVTNEEFGRFVKATGYVTVAERTPKAADFPNAPAEKLVAGSVVFSPTKGPVPLNNHLRWWDYVKGANWRRPDGPGSSLKGRDKHPVVHVAFEDALAYCKWADKRLPTEAEFEFAARGRLDRNRYAWGNELRPGGKWMLNIWQGRFPYENTEEDGYRATSPVGTFPVNGYGLYDVAGNVWQWCSDWYRYDTYEVLARQRQPVRNPQGPDDSHDPSEPRVVKRVMRGGSYLCTDQYCTAYEVGARGKGAPDTGTNHLGFRCVKSVR
jgi:formylglycine-generating enzyme required for sulfatase activity